MNLEIPQFPTGDVLKVLDWENAALQNVLSRGHLGIPSGSPGKGGRRLFSAEQVLQLALAKHLMDSYGLGPYQATWVISDHATRHIEGQLLEYLAAPTGAEMMMFSAKLGPEDKATGMHFRVLSTPIELDEWEWFRGAIILPVGAIAKDVFGKLKGILNERQRAAKP